MNKFIATPHRPEISVRYDEHDNSLTISINHCPGVNSEELNICREIEMHAGEVPRLIDALTKAYECATGEKP